MQDRDTACVLSNKYNYNIVKMTEEQSNINVSRIAPSIERRLGLQPQNAEKHDLKQRWIILLFACLIMFGLYYL